MWVSSCSDCSDEVDVVTWVVSVVDLDLALVSTEVVVSVC